MRTYPYTERLEPRRLLSLVIDLRLTGGGKQVTVDHIGQTIQMQAWAVVTGNNANTGDEGLQIAAGSLLSTNTAAGSVRGDLSATRVAPFNALGSADPAQVDLDGDGDLDAGSNNNADADGFLGVRSATVTAGGTPSALGGVEFKIANVTFVVTSLLAGTSTTQLNFRPRKSVEPGAALWREDGQLPLKTGATGSYLAGAPVVVRSTGGGGAGSIGGVVFNDVNQNGDRDTGEPGFGGRTVFLDSDQDGKLDAAEVSTTTDTSGAYIFKSLSGGTYHVAQVLPAGYTQITPDSAEYTIALAAGENRRFVDFADSTLSQIRGVVYDDLNRNGTRDTGEPARQGINVYIDSNHNAALDTGEPLVATDSSGAFALKNLGNGNYDVRAKNPLASEQFLPALRTVSITAGGTTVNGVNFGAQPVTGTISGLVIRDVDADGFLDTADVRLSSWLVWLDTNDDGEIDAGEKIAVTDATGSYRFTNVPAGTYNVRTETTPGLRVNVPSIGKYVVSIIQRGQVVSGKNFYLALATAATASITGTVYDDADGDGVRDASEHPLPNWRVYLDANRNALLDPDEKTTLTDANGAFTFGNLFPGTYRMRETLRSGYRRITPGAGYYDFTVAAGATRGGAVFGNTTLATAARASTLGVQLQPSYTAGSTRLYDKLFGERPPA